MLLSNLESLAIRSPWIDALPECIGQLAKLETLALRDTRIRTLPESIGQLANLRTLVLSGTGITALPETIGQLGNLRELFLRGTKLTALPESIGQLSALRILSLSDTELTGLPTSFGQLTALETLYLSGTRIQALPDELRGCRALTGLNLSRTAIRALPDWIGSLSELRFLALRETELTALPPALRELKRLRMLDLSDARIAALPDWIGELPALDSLSLNGLKLPAIPASLGLKGLPFVSVRTDDFIALLDKFAIYGGTPPSLGVSLWGTRLALQKGSIFLENPALIPSLYETQNRPVRECRVIFLGDGAAGKSYTIRRFREQGRKEPRKDAYATSETPGVEILDYAVERGADSFTIHFWDFGGQQLLHSMHRCFLSEDSCYVVTVKTRDTEAKKRARYWLRNVRAFAPNSPILLYVNCWEEDDGKRSIDEPALRKEFPMIRQVVYCSAKRADDAEFRTKLMEPVEALAAGSEGCTKLVPLPWIRVGEAIRAESRSNNYLTQTRYLELCREHGVEDEQAPELLRFFNSLGVCFSYALGRNRRELNEYKLLSPVWLTNAIYAVIKEGMAFAENGRIREAAIRQLLCNPAPQRLRDGPHRRTAPELVYREQECGYLLAVAELHELCYRVDRERLFFPALCGTNTPEAALEPAPGFPNEAVYAFRYEYLPDSVVHRLMIRFLRKRYAVDECWLEGMVLGVLEDHRVVIRMQDETLRIECSSAPGHRAFEIFPLLREEILSVNEALNLTAKEWVICDTDEFKVIQLLRDQKRKREEIDGDSGKSYQIYELLERFFGADGTARLEISDQSVILRPYRYHPMKQSDPLLRRAIFEAYGEKTEDGYLGRCQYCGEVLTRLRDMQIDHILARKHLPAQDSHVALYLEELRSKTDFDPEHPDFVENYFPVCGPCNNRKRNETRNAVTLREYHAVAMKHTPEVLRRYRQLKLEARQPDGEPTPPPPED